MKSFTFSRRVGGTALFLLLLASLSQCARAQTGPALLIKPWPDKGQVSDGFADAYFFNAGHVKGTNEPFKLTDYESIGRFRILPGNEISPRIGYEFMFLDNDTHGRVPHLPNQLSDESIALGTGIARFHGWIAAITMGMGYAGSSAFDVGSAWYGKADLVFAHDINANDSIGFIIDYDGHRTILPDSPLPGVGFSHRFDPQLQVVVGFPYASVSWKPLDRIDVEAEANVFGDIRGTAGYEFIKGWTVYGSVGYVRNSFRAEGLGAEKRLLFYERRAEVGIRYSPITQFTAKVALGYEWDGSYRSGWDTRRSRLVADFSDVPYLRGGVEWKF